MISNREYIELFITRSLEKSVDDLMLSDKNFLIPKNKIHEYVENVLSIPYIEYIDYIRNNIGSISDDQLTQSSSFSACTTDMCRAIEWQGNLGMHFVEIGQLFPQYVKVKNDAAYRKYGENQIKTSTQLGLTFEYYGCWYLTCVGYIYNELDAQQHRSLLARTILRTPLYQHILTNILERDVDLTDYMQSLSDSTKGRRSGSILRMINICLDECRKNNITYHNLFSPKYSATEKRLVMAIQDGFNGYVQTLELDFSHKTTSTRQYPTDAQMLNPEAMLYSVDDDKNVRTLVFNMMGLYEGTTIMKIAVECQKEFQQKYYGMKTNDWLNLLSYYVRKVTERPTLQDEETFRFVMVG